MHEHSYIGCEHDLKHCKHCDVVFCEKCKREWKQHAAINEQLRDYLKPTPYKDTTPPWERPWERGPQWTTGPNLCGHYEG